MGVLKCITAGGLGGVWWSPAKSKDSHPSLLYLYSLFYADTDSVFIKTLPSVFSFTFYTEHGLGRRKRGPSGSWGRDFEVSVVIVCKYPLCRGMRSNLWHKVLETNFSSRENEKSLIEWILSYIEKRRRSQGMTGSDTCFPRILQITHVLMWKLFLCVQWEDVVFRGEIITPICFENINLRMYLQRKSLRRDGAEVTRLRQHRYWFMPETRSGENWNPLRQVQCRAYKSLWKAVRCHLIPTHLKTIFKWPECENALSNLPILEDS